MSAPFTPVTSTNLQNLALYHEVLLAHYERDAARGQAYTVPDLSTVWPPGLNVQQAALYRGEQSFLQGNEITGFGGTYNRFLDPAADIEGAAELPYLTLVRWRELANLHPDGFRRVTGNAWPADWTDLDDPAYSYGYCQAGDIIGPWLLTDIQRAYAPLTIVSYLPADSDAWIPDGHTTLSREWSGWAAMVADPTFAGGDSRATNVGEKPGRYLTTTFGPLGIFWRNRWAYSPWAGCSRAVTLWALPVTSSSVALDGLGDFVPTANVLQPISIAPAGTLQFSWDSWDSESFTPSASPPAYPPYTWLGHLSSWRLTAAYSFTNA